MTEKNWMTLCHLSALAMFIIPGIGNIIGPLVVWLLKKDEFPAVDTEGKEALNFQITVTIALLVGWILSLVLIGIVLIAIVGLANILFIVLAAIETSNGRPYRYPFKLDIIK